MIILHIDKLYAKRIICVKMSVLGKKLLRCRSESKMFLRKIGECDNDGSRKYLGNSRVEMHVLNQDIQNCIIQK